MTYFEQVLTVNNKQWNLVWLGKEDRKSFAEWANEEIPCKRLIYVDDYWKYIIENDTKKIRAYAIPPGKLDSLKKKFNNIRIGTADQLPVDGMTIRFLLFDFSPEIGSVRQSISVK